MSDRPNILLIMTDQHRLAAVGAYGPTPCRTPNLDRLAADGVRFQTAYTTCPLCSPARASVITGLYPHAHGMNRNIHELGCSQHELVDSPDLLPRRLDTAGYRLGYTGKWHLGSERTKTRWGTPCTHCLPRDVGFRGMNVPDHGNGGFNGREYREYLTEHGLRHEVAEARAGVGELTGPLESTVPWFLVEHSLGLVSELAAPWFLWHNFWGPHAPYFAPTPFLDIYRDVEIPRWPNYEWPAATIPGPHQAKLHPLHRHLDWRDWQDFIRHYYASTSFIDDQVGRLLAGVDLDNTVVIFTADHGETLGSHGGLYDKGFSHFEETQRIPMIVRFPDHRWAGRVVDDLVSLADVYPTILDLAGVASPPGRHGRSLLPLLRGETRDWRRSIVIEDSWECTLRTIRKGQWKYGFSRNWRDELYDLDADPWETVNRIADPACASAAAELREELRSWMTETGDSALGCFLDTHASEHPEWIANSSRILGNPVHRES